MKKIIFIPLLSIIILSLLGVIEARGVTLFWVSFYSTFIFYGLVKALQKLALVWENINIQISYNPDYSKAHKQITGERLAHLEIKADERLPMTETGYRSHFTAATNIETYGSSTEFVQAWLAEASQSKEWQRYKKTKAQKQQLSLF